MRNAWVVVLLVFFVLGGNSEEGGRPQLVNNRVVPLSATIGNNYKEYLLTTLEFDEDVYVNDPFLCAGQEEDCVMMECEPCDWSGNEVFFFFFFSRYCDSFIVFLFIGL